MSLPRRDRDAPLILIVDDDDDACLIAAEFLRFRGFDASTAASADQAFAIVAEQRPDVIVMDYSMPGTECLSATRLLAADPAVAVIFNYELNDEHHPARAGKDDGWGLTYGPEGAFARKAAYHEFKKLLEPVPGEKNR